MKKRIRLTVLLLLIFSLLGILISTSVSKDGISPAEKNNKKLTKIKYTLAEDAVTAMVICNKNNGRPVKTFIFKEGSNGGTKGENTIIWDGRNDMKYLMDDGEYSVKMKIKSKKGTISFKETSIIKNTK